MKLNLPEFWESWTETQKRFCSDFTHPEQLFIGGWGCGKTTAGVRKAIILSYMNPGSRGVIIRATYRELFDSTVQTFWEQCPPELIEKYYKKDEYVLLKTKNPELPSAILFRSADNPQKFQSLELHYAYIDEGDEVFQDENTYYIISRRLRQAGMPNHFLFITSAAPPRHSILHKLFVEEKNENRVVYRASSYENKENLPPHYIKQLEELPEDLKRRFLHGEWGLDLKGKAVFSEFNSSIHVQPLAPIPGYEIIRSWDFGFHHPACLFCQIDGNMRLNVLAEYMGTDLYLTDFARRVMNFSQSHFPGYSFRDVCDPSGIAIREGGSTLELLRSTFGIQPIYRRVPVMERVNMIKKLLVTLLPDGKPSILIDPSCEVLIGAMSGGYHFPSHAAAKAKDEPVKDGYYDHLVDCLGYVVSVFMPAERTTIRPIRRPGILRR